LTLSRGQNDESRGTPKELHGKKGSPYFNYCEVEKDGKTPAMRLGFSRGRVAPEDIVYSPLSSRLAGAASRSNVRPESLRSLQP
jgi:hypothetical protein